MQWPACSPDLNPIEYFYMGFKSGLENLWSVLKRNIYSCGRQYASKDDFWDAILNAAKDISSDELERLTSSMDQSLLSLINKNGSYVNY